MNRKNIFKTLLVFAIVISGCNTNTQNNNQEAYQNQTREYYVAAENVIWDYAPDQKDLMTGGKLASPWGDQTKYEKVRFIEYTDETFTTKKEQPEWLGILGPIIRGVEGDTIKVHFFNKADKPYSMHPHGLKYDKDNEGASHIMPVAEAHEGHAEAHNNMQMGMPIGAGGQIEPGEKYTYEWFAGPESAPNEEEGGSKVWLYHSHVDSVQDIYDGLMGAIIVTSKAHATANGLPDDVDKEFITLFMVFNESQEGMSDEETEGSLMHGINGYIFSNLKGLNMAEGDRVKWHLLALGTEVDLHSAHWHGEVVKFQGYQTDVIELMPASMKSVYFVADNVGTWMFHCHVADHITAGMQTMYTITQK